MAAPVKKSLRDRLAQRERPTLPYMLRVDDTKDAEAELDKARRAHRVAAARQDEDAPVTPEHEAATARVEAAEAALLACYEELQLRAMPPADYEALLSAHPPTKEQEEKGDAWNSETLRAPLIAETVQGDMSAEEWVEFLDSKLSSGEREGLFSAALMINGAVRAASPAWLPKGLPAILN